MTKREVVGWGFEKCHEQGVEGEQTDEFLSTWVSKVRS